MILDQIVRHKREEVQAARAKRAHTDVVRQALGAPSAVSLLAALAQGEEVRVIAECKKASPSKGVIRADYNPAEIARAYEEHGAAAVSVLTDRRFFQGSMSDLQRVRQAVSLPLLRKDFIIDEYQIFEARAAAADAVLLICAILDRHQLRDYVEIVEELKMDALVEIHDLRELEAAVENNTGIVGVNNRNLDNFEVDLAQTAEAARLLPDDLLLVSESGIHNREDIEFVASVGAKAVLIGEAFMSAADPGQALKELLNK
jgi:indole-3-glycerol phosphate synthase